MIAEDPLYWDPEDNVDDITRNFLEKVGWYIIFPLFRPRSDWIASPR